LIIREIWFMDRSFQPCGGQTHLAMPVIKTGVLEYWSVGVPVLKDGIR